MKAKSNKIWKWGISFFLVILSIIIHLSKNGIEIYRQDELKSLIKQEICSFKFSGEKSIFFQKMEYDISVKSVNVDLKGNKIKLTNCKIDAYCKIMKKEIRYSPSFSGSAELVQRGNRIYLENISFSKIVSGSKKFDRFIKWAINKYISEERYQMFQSNWLNIFDVDFRWNGVYAVL